jgi:hypothetical protein
VFREDGDLTPRYCLMLIAHLPEDSAFVAAHRGGPEFRPWTGTLHMLAALVNLTYAANRQRGGKATRKPLIKPPTKKRPKTLTVAQILARQKKEPEEGGEA